MMSRITGWRVYMHTALCYVLVSSFFFLCMCVCMCTLFVWNISMACSNGWSPEFCQHAVFRALTCSYGARCVCGIWTEFKNNCAKLKWGTDKKKERKVFFPFLETGVWLVSPTAQCPLSDNKIIWSLSVFLIYPSLLLCPIFTFSPLLYIHMLGQSKFIVYKSEIVYQYVAFLAHTSSPIVFF